MLLSPWPTYKKKAKKIAIYTYNNNIRVCLLIRCTFPKKNEPVKCQLAGRDKQGPPRDYETTRRIRNIELPKVVAAARHMSGSPPVCCCCYCCFSTIFRHIFHLPFSIFNFPLSMLMKRDFLTAPALFVIIHALGVNYQKPHLTIDWRSVGCTARYPI